MYSDHIFNEIGDLVMTREQILAKVRHNIEQFEGCILSEAMILCFVKQASDAYHEGFMEGAEKAGEACRASMIKCMRRDGDYSNN